VTQSWFYEVLRRSVIVDVLLVQALALYKLSKCLEYDIIYVYAPFEAVLMHCFVYTC